MQFVNNEHETLGLCKTSDFNAISAASQQQEGGFQFWVSKPNYFSLSVFHITVNITVHISDQFGRVGLNLC